MARDGKQYELTNHVCRKCGGRVGRYLGSVVTGGGNPLWVCIDCEDASAGMFPSVVCWCGYQHPRGGNGQGAQTYGCFPRTVIQSQPWMQDAFAQNGYFPDGRWQVGVVALASLPAIEARWNAAHPEGRDPLIQPLEEALKVLKEVEDTEKGMNYKDARNKVLHAGVYLRRVLRDLQLREVK